MILGELCQNFNFDIAKKTYNFTFDTSLTTTSRYPNIATGGGPYPLPADFLRMVDDKDNMWFLNGVPYSMIPCDLSEYDNLVQQAGNQAYPYIFATDMAPLQDGDPPNLVVWPPPAGNYSGALRYFSQMDDITTPESSAVVPWFPNQMYLLKRLAGELMSLAGDSRADIWLGDTPQGAMGILSRYLKLKDDSSNRAKRVQLDRRRFRKPFAMLRNTKAVGW